MNTAGWLLIEATPWDIEVIQKETFEDKYYKAHSLPLNSNEHSLGKMHDIMLLEGFREEIGLNIDGTYRYLYTFNGKGDVKSWYSMMQAFKELPIKVNGLGVGVFDENDIVFTRLYEGKLAADMVWDTYNISQKTTQFIDKISSSLMPKERALLAFSNTEVAIAMSKIELILNGDLEMPEKIN